MSRFLLPSLLSLLAAAVLLSCGEDKKAPASSGGNGGSGAATAGKPAAKANGNAKAEADKTEATFTKFLAKKDDKSESFLTSTIADDSAKLFKHCCTADKFQFNIELKLNADKTYTFKFTPHHPDYEEIEFTGKWKVEAPGVTLLKLGKLSLASSVATKEDVVYLSFDNEVGGYDLSQHKGLILGTETFPIPPVLTAPL